jgi:hypothetical protein
MTELGPLRNRLHDLFVALIKAALVPDAGPTEDWREDAARLQAGFRSLPADVLPSGLHLNDLWATAIDSAQRDPTVCRGEDSAPVLSRSCPLTWAEIVGTPFDIERTVAHIRRTAMPG